jgi:AcrR family transcriptional regulator
MTESIDGYERRRRIIRNQILDAATSLIKARGDTDMTVREIASCAGVSPATPFNHFKSKDGIFGAIVTRSMRELYGNAQDNQTVTGGFIDITNYYIANQELYKPVFRVVLQTIPPTSRTLQMALDGIRRRIELQIQRGQLSAQVAPSVLAEQLEIFWFGTVILWSGGTFSSDEWLIRVELGIELMLNGLYLDTSRAKSTRRVTKLLKQIPPLSNR